MEILVLLYVCDSKTYGTLTKEELARGLKKLGIKNTAQWRGW